MEIQTAAQEEAKHLQQFHFSQTAEMEARKAAERKEALTYDKRNRKLLQVEEYDKGNLRVFDYGGVCRLKKPNFGSTQAKWSMKLEKEEVRYNH